MSSIKERSDMMYSFLKKVGIISLIVFIVSNIILICFSIKTDTTVDDTIFGMLGFLSFGSMIISFSNMKGHSAEQVVMYKASKENPDMEYNDFLYEYGDEIDAEQERMDRAAEEAAERRRQEEIIRKERERERNFDRAKNDYAYHAGQLANPYRDRNSDKFHAEQMAKAEADIHKYSN